MIGTALAVAAFGFGATGASSNPPAVNDATPTEQLSSARRVSFPAPALSEPIHDIAIIGDSIYFDHATIDFGPPNVVAPRIRALLRSGLGAPNLRVRNLSRPGLATAFPTGARHLGFITIADHLPNVLGAGEDDLPDLVVLPATTIDLNLNVDEPLDALLPGLVAEFGRLVDDLHARGIQVVIVPAFGINDTMYDTLKSAGAGRPVRCHANSRAQALNAALDDSDLPMLFPRFIGLDADFDGDADERLFVDHNPGLVVDDGLHPNEVGHRLIADQIASHLVSVIAAARSR